MAAPRFKGASGSRRGGPSQKAPTAPLGYPSNKDYAIFKAHLRIPAVYLASLLRGRQDMSQVPMRVPDAVNTINQEYWRTMMHSTTELAQQARYLKLRNAGIPATYRDDLEPVCAEATQRVYTLVKQNPKKFIEGGRLVYLYSEMQTTALLAAAGMVESVLSAGSAFMLDFGSFLEEVRKGFERGQGSGGAGRVRKLETVDVACLYLIGTEYVSSSGFTESVLESLVRKRQMDKRTTILVSHLTPEEFSKRYGRHPQKDWGAVPMKFTDESVTCTIGQLAKELAS